MEKVEAEGKISKRKEKRIRRWKKGGRSKRNREGNGRKNKERKKKLGKK